MAHYESLNQSDHSSEYKWKFKTLGALLAGTCVTKCVDNGEGSDWLFVASQGFPSLTLSSGKLFFAE